MRGGTSATAAVLDAIGFPAATDGQNDGHFETPAFKSDPYAKDALNEMVSLTRGMNSRHQNWSLQTQADMRHVEGISFIVRNPHLVIVWRDHAAIVQRHLETKEYGQDVPTLMHTVWGIQSNLWYIATHSTLPTILISYERLKTTTGVAIDSLESFFNVTASPQQRAEAESRISRTGGYLIQ